MKRTIVIAFMLLGSVMAGAQDAQPAKTPGTFDFFVKLFSPKVTALEKLVDGAKFDDADAYLRSERQYFTEHKKEQKDLLGRLADGLNARYVPDIKQASSALVSIELSKVESWSSYRRIIKDAEIASATYKGYDIFTDTEFVSPEVAVLDSEIQAAKLKIDSGALSAFIKFDHEAGKNFFAEYPAPLPSNFLAINGPAVNDYIGGLTSEKIVAFKRKYGDQIGVGSAIDVQLQNRYLQLALPKENGPHPLKIVLSKIKDARAAGFAVKSIPGEKIAFVESTSRTLISEGQIEFPTQIEMDLPFEAGKADIDSLLDVTDKTGANLIIVLDVAASKVARRIVAKDEHTST